MKSVSDTSPDPLAMLADAAANSTLEPVDLAALDRMVEVAVLTSGVRRAKRRRWVAVAALAAAVPLAFGAWNVAEPGPPERRAEVALAPVHLSLPTGDRISRLGEGQLEVLSLDGNARRFGFSHGDALFDVAPLGERGRFVVRTPHLRVRVVGTVFALSVGARRTRVQVFEGVVEVVEAGGTRRLERGATYDSQTGDAADWRSVLATLGEAAATRRESDPPRSAPPLAVDSEPDAPPQTPARPAPRSPSPAAPLASLEVARRWLANGDRERARSAALRARRELPEDAAWAAFLGDALRANAEVREAADAYDRAARLSSPSRATQVGYSAARLRLSELADPDGALRSLESSRAAAPGSPIEERAAALAARAQLAAGRPAEARATARRYLLRFPAGGEGAWMRQLAEPDREVVPAEE